MSYEIVWSAKAEKQFIQLFNYLEDYWSIDVAIRFTNDTYDVLETLQSMPFIGKASEQDDRVRMILITPKNSLYYLIEESIIYIIALVDNRQNPLTPKY
jgi:plasmid stabilization system protein ParE